jgi:hypothetical protein
VSLIFFTIEESGGPELKREVGEPIVSRIHRLSELPSSLLCGASGVAPSYAGQDAGHDGEQDGGQAPYLGGEWEAEIETADPDGSAGTRSPYLRGHSQRLFQKFSH